MPAAAGLAGALAGARMSRAVTGLVQAVVVAALCAGGVGWAALQPGADEPSSQDGSGEYDGYDY